MAIFLENVDLANNQSLRLLTWGQDVDHVLEHGSNGISKRLKGAGTHWHYHNVFELTAIQTGNGLRLIGDKIERFHTGDCVLMGAELPHYYRPDGKSSGSCLQFNPHASKSIWKNQEFSDLQQLWQDAQHGISFHGDLQNTIIEALQKMPNASPLERFHLSISIFLAIVSSPSTDKKMLSEEALKIPKKLDPHAQNIAKAIDYLSSHYQSSLQLDDLLDYLNLPRATFARQFKRATKRSFSQFLTELRIQHACALLAQTQRTVTDIAYDSGFNDLPHFNRCFRKQTGCNPLTWRSIQQ